MKLHELLTEASIFDENKLKNTKWESPKHLTDWLKSNGFSRVGTGAFGVVFGKSGHKRVVKISKRQDGCWTAFAKWSMTQTANKYIPNIPWIVEYKGSLKGKQQTFFVTVVERLTPFNNSAIKKIKDPVVVAVLLKYGDWIYDETILLRSQLQSLGHGKSTSSINRILKKNTNHKFVKTLKVVKSITSSECDMDLHADNLMVRKDGTIVITDPLAGFYS